MRGQVVAIRMILLAVLLTAWQCGAGGNGGLSFLPTPWEVVRCTPLLIVEYNVVEEAMITVAFVAISMVLTFALGYTLAVTMARFSAFGKAVEPVFVIIGALPKISLAPIIIILMGFSPWAALVISVLFTLSVTVITTLGQLKSLPECYQLLMNSLGANSWQRLRHVYLPYLLPNSIAVLKANIGACFTGVIIGEMQLGKQGIGFLLYYGLQIYRLDLLILLIGILAALAILFLTLIHGCERNLKI